MIKTVLKKFFDIVEHFQENNIFKRFEKYGEVVKSLCTQFFGIWQTVIEICISFLSYPYKRCTLRCVKKIKR